MVCSCVVCEICSYVKCCSDFGKESLESHWRVTGEKSLVALAKRAWRVTRERESVVVTLATRAWRVTRKLGDFGRERESAWRITRKH